MAESTLTASEQALQDFESAFSHDAAFEADLDTPFTEQTLVRPDPAESPAETTPPARGADGRFLPKQPAPGTYAHDANLVRLARDLNFSPEEIDGTPPEQLAERVYYVNRRTLEILGEQRRQAAPVREQQLPAQQTPAPEPEEQINWDDYDPKLSKFIQAQQAEIKSLKAQLTTDQQSRQAASREQELDGLFAGLERPEIFGDGPAQKIGVRSEEMQRRIAVVKLAQTIEAPTEKSRLDKAAAILFGKKGQAPTPSGKASVYDQGRQTTLSDEEAEFLARQEEYRQGGLAVPSHRKPAPLSPDRRAARAAQKWLSDNPSFFDQDEREP